MTVKGILQSLAWPQKVPMEPVAGCVLLFVALQAAWGKLSPAHLAVMLVMLAAMCVLARRPWAALVLGLGYYIGSTVLSVPSGLMNLCGILLVRNWFFHRRAGMWWLAVGYPVVEMISWWVRHGSEDLATNIVSVALVSGFAAGAGWFMGRRLDSEVEMRVESEQVLRSTRLLMASELHDSVAQTQTLVLMNLEELVEDPLLHQDLAPQVTETLELSRRAAQELRAALAALRAVDQDFMSLGSPVGHTLTQQWNQVRSALGDSGYHAQTRFEIDVDELSHEEEHTLSRLLGELVTNIVWHGAPGVCSVEVFEQEGYACIRTVNALGEGGLRKSGGGGDGLVGIRQRVGMLGGTCAFGAQDATWVTDVKVPLHRGG
ncbi:MAG: histidine kinase [Arachnia propionica]|uniref:histidine kinase n=1 Tax=Arachnia propionica TaxID=1750 RepID=UPI0027000825|nr:histidine kinase [Arachnia propionica]